MIDDRKSTTGCSAPAAGCFGQLSAAAPARPMSEEVIAAWRAVTERCYRIEKRR